MLRRLIGPGNRAVLARERIKLYFAYNPEIIDHVKRIEGRQYHTPKKGPRHWSVPLTTKSVLALRKIGFSIGEELVAWLGRQLEEAQAAEDRYKQIKTAASMPIKGFKGSLIPFQMEGVAEIVRHLGRVLLADEQGLGKTIQILAYLAMHPELRPAIAVVPATAKWDWEAKVYEFLENPEVEVLSGQTAYEGIQGRIIIINWDILADWLDVLVGLKPMFVAADECHYANNSKAIRTKALKVLARKAPQFVPMSGTPGDSPKEMYPIIKMVNKNLFPNQWTYYMRYCGPVHNGFGWVFKGKSNTKELHEILSKSIMIRRLKKDVMPQLPKKLPSVVPIEMTALGRKRYEKAFDDFVARYQSGIKALREQLKADGKSAKFIRERVARSMSAQGLIELEALKFAAAMGKMDYVIEWLEDFLQTGEKILVFGMHRKVIGRLYEKFKGISVKVDGSVVGKDRWTAVQKFQNDPKTRMFFGNYKAAGVNLTLTAASHVAAVELPPRPKTLSQAIDRAHRIGQHKCVNVWYLVGRGTIEEKSAKALDRMIEAMSEVLDGGPADSDSLVGELLEAMC